ncbi:MAG: glycosyltransferase family 2 protein [Cyclobacteriaceae bacterium]|nr:glycosyltransferase family 2 protein [Cyclobacteriaceae bacterium]
MTEVAVVILNYNGRNFLLQFLPIVITCSPGAKIVVADNGSTDDSLEILEKNFSGSVDVIKIEKNLGFCGGYNYALKTIDAEFFVLLNSDIEVTPGWIGPILQVLKSDATIAAAQPKILAYHQKDHFEYAGAAGGFIDALGYPFCRGRLFNALEKDSGQYNDTRPVFWATGACLFIRSISFFECGGLDEKFFAHMEEIDLCWQLNRRGQKVYYVGESVVYHVGGGTLSKSNPRKTYLNFKNGLSLLLKNLPGSQLIWKLPLRLFLDWVAALKFLVQGSPTDCGAVVRAHLNFIGGLTGDLEKRRTLAQQGVAYPITMQYKGFLTIDFFLLGKRTFDKLEF